MVAGPAPGGVRTLDADVAAALEELARAREHLAVAQRKKLLSKLTWRRTARPEQLPPPGRWRVWYVRGGRGAGKTFTASNVLAEWILSDPEPGEWGIVAPTYPDAWSVCVEGESGILAALGTTKQQVDAGDSELVDHWHRSFAELKLRSGHVIRVASAQDGGLRIQGKNLKGAWCDEIGLWDNWEVTWDESLRYAVRKGNARIIATGTPKKTRNARKLIRRLLDDPSVPCTRLRTVDNAANLSPEFLREVVGVSQGTRLERQELEGDLLDDVEGALWTPEMIDKGRMPRGDAPGFTRVVVAVDPAVTSRETSDETGIVVAAEDGNGHGYVLGDYSMRGTPDACMRKAVWAYRHHRADRIIAEANNGADYIGTVLRHVDVNVPYGVVRATRGKAVRAEPVSALYEQGRVHHLGVFDVLEDQMCSFVPAGGGQGHDDRLDALVWAFTELRGLSGGSWLEAYRAVTCEDCGHVYPQVASRCPRCHQPVSAAAGGGEVAGEQPAAEGGWASAYGAARCAAGHAYLTARHSRCPHCHPAPRRGAFPQLTSLRRYQAGTG